MAPLDVGGFEVGWRDAKGEHRRPLGEAEEVEFETGLPVRGFPSYRGQRNFPGLYWSATRALRLPAPWVPSVVPFRRARSLPGWWAAWRQAPARFSQGYGQGSVPPVGHLVTGYQVGARSEDTWGMSCQPYERSGRCQARSSASI